MMLFIYGLLVTVRQKPDTTEALSRLLWTVDYRLSTIDCRLHPTHNPNP